MSDETRKRGEAQWKAERDAITDRNEAARRAAHKEKTSTELATSEREKRAAVAEASSLRALNEQIAGRRRAS